MYTQFAQHFHETRYKPWPGVVSFLQSLPTKTHILDLGCGNGKYLGIRRDCIQSACDPCAALVEIAQSQHPSVDVLVADGSKLPYRSQSMNVVISIAVFHHIPAEQRMQFLGEVDRVLEPGGIFFATVWAHSAILPKWEHRGENCYMVPWHDKQGCVHERIYHIYDKPDIVDIVSTFFTILEIREECKNWYITCKKRLED